MPATDTAAVEEIPQETAGPYPADGSRADFPPGDFTEHDLDVDGEVVTRFEQGDDPVTAAQFGRERITALDLTPDREVALWWDADDAVLLPVKSTEGEE